MTEDSELLRRYAATRAESDFAELVRRHVNLVYSAALRQLNGDAHLAQDVTQEVFTDLARKAEAVAQHRVLAGWLFTSTRFAAAKAVRGEQRRHAREEAAHLMQELNGDPAAQLDWARVRPVLDEVLGELSDADREAILLRFFEGRDFAGVGDKLNVNDNTARMRVDRALDKLRALLERRGVKSTGAALAAALANQAVVAAPAGLVAAVTGAALSGPGVATGVATAGGLITTFMSMTKIQVGITSALAVAGATGFALQAESNAALRREVASLRQENAAIATLQAENLKLARTVAEVADMRSDDAELKRLGAESAAAQKRLQQVARAEQARAAESTVSKVITLTGEVFDVSKLDQTPRPKYQARPQYPFELRRAGVGGQVIVDFLVDSNGDVQNASAVRYSFSRKPDEKTGEAVVLTPVVVAADGSSPVLATSLAELPNIAGVPNAEAVKLFGTAAVDAVSKWKFAAGRKNGRDVVTHMQVPIVFSLSNDGGTPAPASAAPKP